MINTREIAIYALYDIAEFGGYNNIVLKKTLKKHNSLTKTEKGFITELVNATLRNLIYIDYVINSFSKIRTEKLKPFIRSNLRIAVYQLLFMDRIPNSAACNEAVRLTKEKGFKNLAPFVNGVLRNISRAESIPLPDKESDYLEYLSVFYSYPKWILEYWLLEMELSEMEKVLESFSHNKEITICTNTLKTETSKLKEILEEEGMKVDYAVIKDALYIFGSNDISESAAFNKGLFHVMNESSMLALNIMNIKEKETIRDVCAAPGGKSFYLAYLTKDSGKILASDIHPHKIKLLEDGKSRLNIKNLEISLADAGTFNPEFEESCNTLILDLPCSGLGLIRKRPDIKYSKSPEEIESLVKLQRNIFENCYKYVKKGGFVLFSTCTISKKENLENLNFFIENYPFTLEAFDTKIEGLSGQKGFLQILPNEQNFDGFFMAKLRRK